MIAVLLGPPGAGKGTQAKRIKDEFRLTHIATGDLLREAVRRGASLGKHIQDFMLRGRLVPDRVILTLIRDKIREGASGFILDGFPRNITQAEKLDELLEAENKKVDLAINLEVNHHEVVSRLNERVICPECGKTYNRDEFISQPLICKDCGTHLSERNDDNPDTIEERLKVYLRHTLPLIDYYKQKGILHSISGEGTPQEVFQRIVDLLDSLGKS
ncbi:MAG: adenylate kinase [bacterium]